jgi:DNA-binding MarR family transcriptional regulator
VFLYTVNRLPGLTQEELARELCLNKSTVARALTALEERGFVERKSDLADKRVLLVYPTEKAREILPTLRNVSAEWTQLISSGIDEGEMKVFLSVLYKIESNAKAVIGNECGEACKK